MILILYILKKASQKQSLFRNEKIIFIMIRIPDVNTNKFLKPEDLKENYRTIWSGSVESLNNIKKTY